MLAYIARRLLIAVFTIFMISFLSFVIIELPPGDYVDRIILLQWREGLITEWPTPEEEYQLREQWGLNKPMVLRYWDWISKRVFHKS